MTRLKGAPSWQRYSKHGFRPRFSFTGRDILMLAMVDGPVEARKGPLSKDCNLIWARRMLRQGLLRALPRWSTRPLFVEHARAADAKVWRAVVGEYPFLDQQLPNPTALQVLAALPTVHGTPSAASTGLQPGSLKLTLRWLQKQGMVRRMALGNYVLTGHESLVELVAWYRGLFRTPPIGAAAQVQDCIHQRGTEAAWITTDGAVLYDGPRDLLSFDLDLLNLRAARGLTWDSMSSSTRAALSIDRLRWLRTSRYLDYYGLGDSLPSLLQQAVDAVEKQLVDSP